MHVMAKKAITKDIKWVCVYTMPLKITKKMAFCK